ncbi:MAG: hypothetical protein AMJ81_14385 [Phycisphaerae bacterium SM23_33]|nr:MAG: hypothetical protein AMJ81_14385 [Phycisphaerae bacterium SM23_33]
MLEGAGDAPLTGLPETDLTVDEGQTVQLTASAGDPGGDPLEYHWQVLDAQGSSVPGLEGTEADFSFALPDEGDYTVRLTVTDSHGGTATSAMAIRAENVVPEVFVEAAEAVVGLPVEVTGWFVDPGDDFWLGEIDYGDGTVRPLYLTRDKTFAVSHVYEQVGQYTISVRVDDHDGGVGLGTVVVEAAVAGPVTPILGDANGDGVVDGLDYNAWSLHYLEQPVPAWADGGWEYGNFNADDTVDGLDYNVWSMHYLEELGEGADGGGAGGSEAAEMESLMGPAAAAGAETAAPAWNMGSLISRVAAAGQADGRRADSTPASSVADLPSPPLVGLGKLFVVEASAPPWPMVSALRGGPWRSGREDSAGAVKPPVLEDPLEPLPRLDLSALTGPI